MKIFAAAKDSFNIDNGSHIIGNTTSCICWSDIQGLNGLNHKNAV